jgi:thiol-disulfide isomerase/thioredoxin/uncharacterized OsmC-like protein
VTRELSTGTLAAFVVHPEPKPVGDINFVDAAQTPLSLADWKGRVVLVNLWATWCGPCREEMPALAELQRQLGSEDFEVVAISLDRQGAEVARPFLENVGAEALELYLDPSTKVLAGIQGGRPAGQHADRPLGPRSRPHVRPRRLGQPRGGPPDQGRARRGRDELTGRRRSPMDAETLKATQAPIKQRYRDEPEAAVITLKAEGVTGENLSCSVATGRALVEAGLHPATGGSGLQACSGDMLLEALVACAGVTLNAVATALGLELRGATVRAEGDLDFRGTLGVAKDAPVGFRDIRLTFDLDGDIGEDDRANLIRLTERYCVVYQTLRQPPPITVTAGGRP